MDSIVAPKSVTSIRYSSPERFEQARDRVMRQMLFDVPKERS
jgi:hypothetical protein